MAMEDPYGALFTAIRLRLIVIHPNSPFRKADQVTYWIEEALDQMAPSEELTRELSRDVPIALICDGGNRPAGNNSDGTDEEQVVRIWFAAKGPTPTVALTGTDPDKYIGAGAIKNFILDKLMDRSWSVSGWEGPKWEGVEPVSVYGTGRLICVATFVWSRLRET